MSLRSFSRDRALLAAGVISGSVIILFAPTIAAIGPIERYGLQITCMVGLFMMGLTLGSGLLEA